MPSIADSSPPRQQEVVPCLQGDYLSASAALVAGIEEKALLREITGRPGAPLVSRSISHRAPLPHLGPLPPWAYIPPPGTSAYLRLYRQDAVFVRCKPEVPPAATVPPCRAAIVEFSAKSRRHLRHACNNGGFRIRSQFLLTYHNQSPLDGTVVKRDLDRWLKVLRRILPGLHYLWVLEFQERGVPHFHVWLSAEAQPGTELQRQIAAAWVRITQGTEEQERVHADPENWGAWTMTDSVYAEKYASKRDQKDVPAHYQNVGRFWGCSRGFVPAPVIVEPETAAPWSAGWSPCMIERFMERTLRRYHEHCLNRDYRTGQKRKGRRRRSPITYAAGEQNGAFRVPHGAAIVYQLLNYVAEYPPDLGAVRRYENEVPF